MALMGNVVFTLEKHTISSIGVTKICTIVKPHQVPLIWTMKMLLCFGAVKFLLKINYWLPSLLCNYSQTTHIPRWKECFFCFFLKLPCWQNELMLGLICFGVILSLLLGHLRWSGKWEWWEVNQVLLGLIGHWQYVWVYAGRTGETDTLKCTHLDWKT